MFFFSVKQMTRLICVNVLETFLRVSFTKPRKMLSKTDKKVSNPPRCSRLSVRLSGSEKSRNLNSFKVFLFGKNNWSENFREIFSKFSIKIHELFISSQTIPKNVFLITKDRGGKRSIGIVI